MFFYVKRHVGQNVLKRLIHASHKQPLLPPNPGWSFFFFLNLLKTSWCNSQPVTNSLDQLGFEPNIQGKSSCNGSRHEYWDTSSTGSMWRTFMNQPRQKYVWKCFTTNASIDQMWERHTSNEQAFDCSVSYIFVRTRHAWKNVLQACPSSLNLFSVYTTP